VKTLTASPCEVPELKAGPREVPELKIRERSAYGARLSGRAVND
jgi:hypothetical protein